MILVIIIAIVLVSAVVGVVCAIRYSLDYDDEEF